MSPLVTIVELREAIAEALAEEKAYNLPEICTALGLEPGTEEEAFSSKRSYVRKRIISKSLSDLVDLGEKLLERYPNIEDLLNMVYLFKAQAGGVSGDIKNLIFAADGPKPELVLTDALNNTVEIVENAEYCLVYNLPILQSGLLWPDLVKWWTKSNNLAFLDRTTEESLFLRLRNSLASPPEKLFFNSYFQYYHDVLGEGFPALIPQVYLHFDPKSLRNLGGQQRLPRQRMDFLMLLPNNQRIVIEIDGKQHYSENNNMSSPRKYSGMVAEDRRLRLLGYEVYRFGGYELRDDNSNKAQSENLVQNFFCQLFEKHRILPTSET
jgi:very-short-patch-repair endonuclease